MGFSNSDKTDDFDRQEVVVGDAVNPQFKSRVDREGNQLVRVGNSSQIDAWGRIRASLPTTLFELNFNFSDRPLSMYTGLVGGGTATFNYNKSGIDMSVGTASGDRVIRQTRRYFRYVTGKGLSVLTVTQCTTPKTGLVQEWGYFDDEDGQFFRYDSTGINCVVRSSTSGTPVDIVVNQSDWNIDKMDGTGDTGIVLDPTKYHVWLIDFAWQGAGGIRFGIFYNGDIIYFHEYRPSNTLTTPFNRSPVKPVRFQIRNTAITASPSTMYQGTLGVIVDDGGDLNEAALQFSASRGASQKSVGTTLVPILAVRPKLTFNGNVNRIPIQISTLSVVSETQVVYYQVLRNATLTGATFNSVGTNSVVEFDIAATAYTGGEKIDEGYVLASAQGNNINIARSQAVVNKLNYLGLNIDGTVAENLVIVARAIANTSNTLATIEWEEFQ